MWYKIQPFDTLFFRDGKPFTMKIDTWAKKYLPSESFDNLWSNTQLVNFRKRNFRRF
jgi:hypothetical protein